MKTYRMMTPAEIREAAAQMQKESQPHRSFVIGMSGLRLDLRLTTRPRGVSFRWTSRRQYPDRKIQTPLGCWPEVSVEQAFEAATKIDVENAWRESQERVFRPTPPPRTPVVEHFKLTSEVRLPDGRHRSVTIDFQHDYSSSLKVHEGGIPLKTFMTSASSFKELRETLQQAATGQLPNFKWDT